MIYPNYIAEELPEIAQKLVSNFSHLKIWCFYGEMGVGKTTLIKQICEILQVTDQMSSPTFSIINEYESPSIGTIYHFDLYRVEDLSELVNIGVEEYLDSGSLCLIEWPELAEPLFSDQYLEINIKLVSDNARSLIATPK